MRTCTVCITLLILISNEVHGSFSHISCFGLNLGQLPSIDLSKGTLSFNQASTTTDTSTVPLDLCVIGVLGLGAFFALPVILSERNLAFVKERLESGPIILKNLKSPSFEDLGEIYKPGQNTGVTSEYDYYTNPADSSSGTTIPGPHYPANALSGGQVRPVLSYEEGWTGHLYPKRKLTPEQQYKLDLEQYNRQYELKLAEYQKHIAPYKEPKEAVIQNGRASIQNGRASTQNGGPLIPAQNGDTQEYRFGNEELIQEYNYQEPIPGIEDLFLQSGPEQPAATPIIYQAGSQVQQSDVNSQNKDKIVPVYPANVKVSPVYPAKSSATAKTAPASQPKPQPAPVVKEAEIIRGQPAVSNSGDSESVAAPQFLNEASYQLLNKEIENEFDLNFSNLEQDYQDIDYTSGGLVSYHISLSKRKKRQLFEK